MIIDTNALSAFAEGAPEVRQFIASSDGPYLPVVVLGEYRFGLLSSRERIRRLAWLEQLTKYWNILEISTETARRYAEIRHKLKLQGTLIPSNDAWIAALARQHDLAILTNDPHFDLVPGIETIGF